MRGHDGPAHRHRLEDLVLHAARDAQRRHDDARVGEVRTDVGHRAGDDDVRGCKRLHGRRRPHADDVEARARSPRAQRGHHLAREPRHGVDVGPVVHRASEDDRLLVRGERCRERQTRIVVVRVHAVRHDARLRAPTRASSRNRSASASVTKSARCAAAAVDRSNASRRLPSRRYNHDSGQACCAAYCDHFAESTSTKSTSVRKPETPVTYCAIADEKTTAVRIECSAHGPRDPGREARIAIVGYGQRLARGEPGKAAQSCPPRVEPQRAHARALRAQDVDMARIVRVVDERARCTRCVRARCRSRWYERTLSPLFGG